MKKTLASLALAPTAIIAFAACTASAQPEQFHVREGGGPLPAAAPVNPGLANPVVKYADAEAAKAKAARDKAEAEARAAAEAKARADAEARARVEAAAKAQEQQAEESQQATTSKRRSSTSSGGTSYGSGHDPKSGLCRMGKIPASQCNPEDQPGSSASSGGSTSSGGGSSTYVDPNPNESRSSGAIQLEYGCQKGWIPKSQC